MSRWVRSVGFRVLAGVTGVVAFLALFALGMGIWAGLETTETLQDVWWLVAGLVVLAIGSLVLLINSHSAAAWLHYLYGMASPIAAAFIADAALATRARVWQVALLWLALALVPLPGAVWRPERRPEPID